LAIISIAAEDINTLAVKGVSADDSTIDMYWEINIQGYYLHGENVYCVKQRTEIALFVDRVGMSHWTKGCCSTGKQFNKIKVYCKSGS